MDRRDFLETSSIAAAVTLIEIHMGMTASIFRNPKKTGSVLIRALHLQTTTPIPEMKKFYSGTIGLPVSEKPGELIIHAGKTDIHFIQVKQSSRPFYHFAFNIPENKVNQAFAWQKQRTAIIHPNPDGAKNEIVNFSHWNAHSVFFLDPAGNLLEYIARHDLDNASPGDFSVKDILYASEIGFIVNDSFSTGNEVMKATGLAPYRAMANGFWPIGDESGLLLMIRKGRVWSGHVDQPNQTDIFPTKVMVESTTKSNWTLEGYPYHISSAS